MLSTFDKKRVPFLRKQLKRNDSTASSIIVSPQKSEDTQAEKSKELQKPSQQLQKQDVIEITDALVLKLLSNQEGNNLQQFCTNNSINYRIRRDQKPGQIEVLSDAPIGDNILQSFRGAISEITARIDQEIVEKVVKCNADEYRYITKQLDEQLDLLKTLELDFISSIKGNNGKYSKPKLLRHYLVNERFVIKLVRIEKPSLLDIQSLKALLLNIESNQILTDQFGFELIESHKDIKNVIKKNQDSINRNIALITDQIETSSAQNQRVTIVLQTSRNEAECIENLKQLLIRFNNSAYMRNDNFGKIGISVQHNCGRNYFQALLRALDSISEDDDSHLAIPSEIHLFVDEDKEVESIKYFSDQISQLNMKVTMQQKKGGRWLQELQYYGNKMVGGGMYGKNFKHIPADSMIPFYEEQSVVIERAFLKGKDKVYLITPPLAETQEEKKNDEVKKKKGKRRQQEDEIEEERGDVEDVLVDFQKMTETFLSSKIERAILKVRINAKDRWRNIDTISMEQVELEKELCKVFKSCEQTGITTFRYQRNLIGYTLHSRIMKCDFKNAYMQDTISGDVYAIKRELSPKYNYLVDEVKQMSISKGFNIEEVKNEIGLMQGENNNQLDEVKDAGFELRIRGLKDSVGAVMTVVQKLRKEKWIEHVIAVKKQNISKEVMKQLDNISRENNIELEYKQKFNEVHLKGHVKTINRLRNAIIAII